MQLFVPFGPAQVSPEYRNEGAYAMEVKEERGVKALGLAETAFKHSIQCSQTWALSWYKNVPDPSALPEQPKTHPWHSRTIPRQTEAAPRRPRNGSRHPKTGSSQHKVCPKTPQDGTKTAMRQVKQSRKQHETGLGKILQYQIGDISIFRWRRSLYRDRCEATSCIISCGQHRAVRNICQHSAQVADHSDSRPPENICHC